MKFVLKQQKGFTLVELIVSIGVFSVVMVIAIGSLLAVVNANRKAQSFKSVLNNLNFAAESMSRAMRVGSNYHCGTGDVTQPKNCAGGDDLLAFEASDGDSGNPNDQIVYRLENGSIERSYDSGSSYVSITAPEVVIDELVFRALDTGAELAQPSVVISISGFMEINERTRTDFDLQTYISQRLIKRSE